MVWLLLGSAIACEVGATLSLRVASTGGSRRWYGAVVVGYVAAFSLLALTLAHGLGIGVAYGIWTATGVAVTAVASRLLFGEPAAVRRAAHPADAAGHRPDHGGRPGGGARRGPLIGAPAGPPLRPPAQRGAIRTTVCRLPPAHASPRERRPHARTPARPHARAAARASSGVRS